MLETIRQYAREKLLQTGGSETIQERHLVYFVKLVEQAEPRLYRSDQLFWMNKLEEELDNLRMALGWALGTQAEASLRIASLPWRFWNERGYLQEIGEWLRQLLERYAGTDKLRVNALTIYAFSFFRRGDFVQALKFGEQSRQVARTLGDKATEAFSLSFMGVFTLTQGNMRDGTQMLEQALALYRELGDKIGQANTMSWMALGSNDVERGISLVKESLNIYRELGHLTDVASSLFQLARLSIWRGDFSSPVPWLEEALSISRQLGNQMSEQEALITQGNLAYRKGDYHEACAYYEDAISLGEKIGDFYHLLWVRVYLAYVILRQGDVQRARTRFKNSIYESNKAGLTIAVVYAIEGLANLNVMQDQPECAARLFAWADAMREKIGDHRPPVEQAAVDSDLSILHSQLQDDELLRLSAEGQRLTMEEAIDLAQAEE
jgi:tetratricopeptide (TPR) repeat protein